jgi:hypothetical protein
MYPAEAPCQNPVGAETRFGLLTRSFEPDGSRKIARRGVGSHHWHGGCEPRRRSTNHFADFEDLFADQNWVSARLDELEASRNVIAHSNLLDDREMGRIRLYLQDWIRQVG